MNNAFENLDFDLAKFTGLCVLCILLLMALYASSVNKEDASRHRVLVAEQSRCMAKTEGLCYIKVITSEELDVLTQHKIDKGRKYGIH